MSNSHQTDPHGAPNCKISNHSWCVHLEQRNAPRVIISVPHDGLSDDDHSGIWEPKGYGTNRSEPGVWAVCQNIVLNCAKKGISVDAVRSLPHRNYVDMNYPRNRAFIDTRMAPIYDYYYHCLDSSIVRGKTSHGSEEILVLDLHGFRHTTRPDGKNTGFDLIMGTQNRTTIHSGDPDLCLADSLSCSGLRVFVPNTSDASPEGDIFKGGHITKTVSNRHCVNVIQIEIEKEHRKDTTPIGLQLTNALFSLMHAG